jgi:hypothetical protein
MKSEAAAPVVFVVDDDDLVRAATARTRQVVFSWT